MHVFSPKPEKCSLGAGTGTLQLIFLNPQIGTQGIDAKKYQLLLIKKAVGTRLYSMANSFKDRKSVV